jgi:phage tail-like protein
MSPDALETAERPPVADHDGAGATRLGTSMLLTHLPAVMAQDPFLANLVGLFEAMNASVQLGVENIEHHIDVTLAEPATLCYLASWLDLVLDPTGDSDRLREAVRATGRLLGQRGTRTGLEGTVRALTGNDARVSEGGGVFHSRQEVPGPDRRVVVELGGLGDLSEGQLRALIAAEVPVGTEIELRIAAGTPTPASGTIGNEGDDAATE